LYTSVLQTSKNLHGRKRNEHWQEKLMIVSVSVAICTFLGASEIKCTPEVAAQVDNKTVEVSDPRAADRACEHVAYQQLQSYSPDGGGLFTVEWTCVPMKDTAALEK
jgi:hypothetical protein